MKKLLTDKDFTKFEIEMPAQGSAYIYLNGFSDNDYNASQVYDINVTANYRDWTFRNAKIIYLDEEEGEKRYRFSTTDYGSNVSRGGPADMGKQGTGAIKRKTHRMLRPEGGA